MRKSVRKSVWRKCLSSLTVAERGGLLMLVFCVCGKAHAQAVGAGGVAGAGADGSLDTVVVGAVRYNGYEPVETSIDSRFGKSVMDTPRAVSAATPQLLSEMNPGSLAQALATLPGVTSGTTQGGVYDALSLHGFDAVPAGGIGPTAAENDIYVDGVRAPLDHLLNANTEAVNVLTGPESFLYGSSNPGGIVDVQRKQPLTTSHAELDLGTGYITGSLRDFNGSVDVTGPLLVAPDGTLAYRFVAGDQHDDYWRNVGHASYDVLVAPTLAWYGKSVQATLAFEHEEYEAPYDRGTFVTNGAIANFPITRAFTEPWSFIEELDDWVHGKIDIQAGDNTRLQTRYSYGHTHSGGLEFRYDNPGNYDPATGILSSYAYNPGNFDQNQVFLSQAVDQTFRTGPIRHELVAGVDFYNTTAHIDTNLVSSPEGNNLQLNVNAPNYALSTATPYPLVPGQPDPVSSQHNSETGVFAEDTLTAGRVSVTGGVRYDRDYTYEANYGFIDYNETNKVVLPHGALLFRPQEWLTLYGSYSQSFIPNIYAPQPGTTLSSPVLPTKGAGDEVGAKARLFEGKLLVTGDVFLINLDHVLTVNDAGQLAFSAAQRSEGLDMSVAGQLTPGVAVSASYSYLEAFYSSDTATDGLQGKRRDNAPRHHAGIFADYHFSNRDLTGLKVGGGVTAQTANAVDPQNSAFLPGFAVFNGFAAYDYRLRDKPFMSFQLNVNNLFNKRYFPESDTKSIWVPYGLPRQWLLAVKVILP